MGTDYQYIGWGQDDGMIIGNSGESIGFWGTTPTTQVTVTSAAITAVCMSASSAAGTGYVYGYATAAQADLIAETVRQIRAALVAYGIIAEP